MSENHNTSSSPIRRNAADVAIELMHLHLEREGIEVSEIDDLYAKYYALAKSLENTSPSTLIKLVDEDIVSKVWKK